MEVLQNAAPQLHPIDIKRLGTRFKPMTSNVREPITVDEIFGKAPYNQISSARTYP